MQRLFMQAVKSNFIKTVRNHGNINRVKIGHQKKDNHKKPRRIFVLYAKIFLICESYKNDSYVHTVWNIFLVSSDAFMLTLVNWSFLNCDRVRFLIQI